MYLRHYISPQAHCNAALTDNTIIIIAIPAGRYIIRSTAYKPKVVGFLRSTGLCIYLHMRNIGSSTGTGTVAGGAASGDTSNIGLWIAIMAVLAVAAAAVVFIFFKKKKADQ